MLPTSLRWRPRTELGHCPRLFQRGKRGEAEKLREPARRGQTVKEKVPFFAVVVEHATSEQIAAEDTLHCSAWMVGRAQYVHLGPVRKTTARVVEKFNAQVVDRQSIDHQTTGGGHELLLRGRWPAQECEGLDVGESKRRRRIEDRTNHDRVGHGQIVAL